MDVLLINARSPSPQRLMYQKSSTPPLSLSYLATPLIEHNIHVSILDMVKKNMDRYSFAEFIKRNQPKIIGISCITQSFSNCVRLSQLIKNINPSIYVIAGGPHVTFTIDETLSHPGIDFIVLGEGDKTFLELTQLLLNKHDDLEKIKGITFRKNGKIINTGRRRLITNMDLLLIPDRDILELCNYNLPGFIFSGRGCIGKCIYCSERAMNGGTLRVRSLDLVMNEIEYLIDKWKVKYIFIADETFTALPERTRKFCTLLKERQLQIKWGCESRVDVEDVSLFETMAKSGCVCIDFGGESGANSILSSIRKNTTKEQIKKTVLHALQSNISPTCSFMIGHPEDTRSTIMQTIELAYTLGSMGCEIALAITTPYPGTYLYNHAEDLGLKILTNNWDDYNAYNPVFNTKNLTADELRELFFSASENINNYPGY